MTDLCPFVMQQHLGRWRRARRDRSLFDAVLFLEIEVCDA